MTGKGLLYDVKLKKNMEIKIKMNTIFKKNHHKLACTKKTKNCSNFMIFILGGYLRPLPYIVLLKSKIVEAFLMYIKQQKAIVLALFSLAE